MVLDSAGTIVFSNSHARSLFAGHQLSGGHFWELLPAARQPAFRQGFQKARVLQTVIKFDEFVPELGRWYLISVHPLPEEKLLLFLRDTSTAVEEDYRTRTLLQHSSEGLLLLNADLSEQYHHDAFTGRHGPVTLPVGRTHLSCLATSDRQRFIESVRLLEPGRRAKLRYRLRVNGSGWRWVQANVTNRLDDPGTRALVVNYRDVTAEQLGRAEIKRRQAELRKTGESLQLRMERLRNLHRVAQIAASDNISLDVILKRVLQEVAPEDSADSRVFIASNEQLTLVADSYREAFPAGSPADHETRRLAVRALDQGKTLTFSAAIDSDVPEIQQLGYQLGFAIPFRKSGTRGVTVALLRFPPEDVTEMRNYTETITGFFTSTVAARHLIERLERSAADSHTLARFGHLAERVATPEQLLEQGVATLYDELNLRLVQFCDVTDGRVVPRAVLGPRSAAEQVSALKELPAVGVLNRAVNHKLAALANNLSEREDEPALFQDFDLESAMAVPLQTNGKVRHVLVMGHDDRARQFTEAELSFSVLFAERLTTALQRVDYLEEIKGTRDAMFRALGRALEYRDYETHGHTDRVTRLSRSFARALSLSNGYLQAFTWGAYLHDLGKLGIPDGILQKPGRLTPAEFDIVKLHTVYGAEMCADIPFLPEATHQIVRSHHERWDGTGYPDGLAGSDIPFPARLFALVDVFDALTTERVYKQAWPVERALMEIERLAGEHFDPELVPQFLKLIRSGAATG